LVDLGRQDLHQLVVAVDVLDSELHALALVLALHGIGARQRDGATDVDRVTLRARRPGADRGLALGMRPAHARQAGNQRRTGHAGARAEHLATGEVRQPAVSELEVRHLSPPLIWWCPTMCRVDASLRTPRTTNPELSTSIGGASQYLNKELTCLPPFVKNCSQGEQTCGFLTLQCTNRASRCAG